MGYHIEKQIVDVTTHIELEFVNNNNIYCIKEF